MSVHSPEPWETLDYKHAASIEIRSPRESWPVAHVRKGAGRGPDRIKLERAEANAARIMACVNGMAGVSNPTLAAETLRLLADRDCERLDTEEPCLSCMARESLGYPCVYCDATETEAGDVSEVRECSSCGGRFDVHGDPVDA